jgi:hypothetical protein
LEVVVGGHAEEGGVRGGWCECLGEDGDEVCSRPAVLRLLKPPSPSVGLLRMKAGNGRNRPKRRSIMRGGRKKIKELAESEGKRF